MKVTARFFGGPCDNGYRVLTLTGPPPNSLECGGATYSFIENAKGDLIYGSPAYISGYNAKAATAGQRDVFRAWHRLMHTLAFRNVGERQRVIRARQRIKRAVR